MGDVLVYIEESAIDEGRAARLLGWARPLATASGGSLVALVASADGVTADRLPAADVVLHAQHPALSPYLPEAHQAVLGAAIAARTPDAVVLENTTSGWDLAAASAIGAGLPFVGSCEEVSISGRHGADDERRLRRTARREHRDATAGGVRRHIDSTARRSNSAPVVASSRRSRHRPHSTA